MEQSKQGTKEEELNRYRQRIRHSAAHVMAEAVTQLFPQVLLTIGPPTDDGFYYDFALSNPFKDEDLERITAHMHASIKANTKFEERKVSRKEAMTIVANNPYKVEILEGIPEDEQITLVSHSNGQFTDLCRGMHVPRTNDIKAFKLLNIAGAYWRGDEKRPMLQRIYGTAWESREAMKTYLTNLKEAENRDHRKLGKRLNLFFFDDTSPGSPFFSPNGTFVVNSLVDYMRQLYHKYGYQEIITPQIFDTHLWKRSGHYDNYAESMFFINNTDGEKGVKPMNCPAAAIFFKSQLHSYRNLPLRLADFGRLHRNERSGVTHGLTRVRSFVQDDAHIFCTPEQIVDEVKQCLTMLTDTYRPFGFAEHTVVLSMRPEKRIGSDAMWDKAEFALEQCLKDWGAPYSKVAGEGAFYGPKIDVFVPDAIGRKWQLGTVQADFSLATCFNLEYIAKNGKRLHPVIIHRALLGSIERFFGILLEHMGGRLPVWLAPTQVVIVPITDNHNVYAQTVGTFLTDAGLRVTVDTDGIRMSAKIRNARLLCVPYTLIVGDKEVQTNTATVRSISDGDLGPKALSEIKERLLQKITKKELKFDW